MTNNFSLYETLGVESSASATEIKKAYYRLALKHHPDKEPSPSAHEKFKTITHAYSVLSDPTRKARYDATGSVADLDLEGTDWEEVFKNLFGGRVTFDSLAQFEKNYKGSPEEREDLLVAYEAHGGDMNKILQTVMLASPDDEERFVGIVKEELKKGEINKYRMFARTTTPLQKKRRREEAEAEAAEAEEARKELKTHVSNTEEDLAKAIQERGAKRFDDLMARLEEKYVNNPKKRKRKAAKLSKNKPSSSLWKVEDAEEQRVNS